jgi:hypothetical protein
MLSRELYPCCLVMLCTLYVVYCHSSDVVERGIQNRTGLSVTETHSSVSVLDQEERTLRALQGLSHVLESEYHY